MVCLRRQYHSKFFKGCLPQILLGPSLNILPHLTYACLHSQVRDTVEGKESRQTEGQ